MKCFRSTTRRTWSTCKRLRWNAPSTPSWRDAIPTEASRISESFLKASAAVEGAVVVVAADAVTGRDHAWRMLDPRRSWKVLCVK